MNCEQCRENFTALGKGQLSALEHTSMQLHLNHCTECTAELAAMQQLFTLLDHEEPVPEQVAARFNTWLLKQPVSKARLPGLAVHALFRKYWPARPAWAFAYSLVLLSTGLVGGQLLPSGMLVFPTTSIEQQNTTTPEGGKTALVCPVHSSPAFLQKSMPATLT